MQNPQRREFKSDFARKYFASGRAEGEAHGRAEGEARAVLRVLSTRGIAVSDEQRERILACSDLTTLETWLDRAVVATHADELFR